jgi:hypothetical protein
MNYSETSRQADNDLTPLDRDLKALLFEPLIQISQGYREIFLEYCLLSLQEDRTEVEEQRLDALYEQAIDDSVLNFWLEEADHLIAHLLEIIDDAYLEDQQDKLRRLIRFQSSMPTPAWLLEMERL